MRLIDADNVRDLFDAEFKETRKLILAGETHLDNLAEGFTEADRVIRQMPTVDAEAVVHGRWTAQCVVETDCGWTLEDMPYNEYQHSNPICSICRKTALLDGGEDYVTSPYCPNCGAKMDGDSDD